MKRLLALCLFLGAANSSHAVNLLTNGGFEAGSGSVYFDGSDSSVADDEPGWELFLGASDGSYVLVSPEPNPLAGTRDADMGIGPGGGGLKTAVGSRPAVTPTISYIATVTSDNYFGPNTTSFFIDWFNGGGALLSSIGGGLTDPNGPLTYAPYTQLFSVSAAAPAGAASAGVRFQSGDGSYNGLAADQFTFGVVPEPTTAAALLIGVTSLATVRRRGSRTS